MRTYDTTYSGLYRSRDGIVFGVCRGLADHLDISVTGVRIATVVGALCTGFWPAVFVYGVAALLMKKEPYIRW